jgi:hypothetical protein
MSQPRITEQEKVKGVQFTFVNFLWGELRKIRQDEVGGNYIAALNDLISLLKYMPKGVKDNFREQIKTVKKEIAQNMRVVDRAPSTFSKGFIKEKTMQTYCKRTFDEFMDAFLSELDGRGYLEMRGDAYPISKSSAMRERREQQPP